MLTPKAIATTEIAAIKFRSENCAVDWFTSVLRIHRDLIKPVVMCRLILEILPHDFHSYVENYEDRDEHRNRPTEKACGRSQRLPQPRIRRGGKP